MKRDYTDIAKRMSELERQIAQYQDDLRLEDGTVVTVARSDRLDALLAAIDGEEHPLHDHLNRLHEEAEPLDLELADLVYALKDSEEAAG